EAVHLDQRGEEVEAELVVAGRLGGLDAALAGGDRGGPVVAILRERELGARGRGGERAIAGGARARRGVGDHRRAIAGAAGGERGVEAVELALEVADRLRARGILRQRRDPYGGAGLARGAIAEVTDSIDGLVDSLAVGGAQGRDQRDDLVAAAI